MADHGDPDNIFYDSEPPGRERPAQDAAETSAPLTEQVGLAGQPTEPPAAEQPPRTPVTEDDWRLEDVQILLPAWSETTVATRMVPAPPVPGEPPRERSAWRSCLTALIAALVVISLVGSSLISVYWFWTERNGPTVEDAALFAAAGGAEDSQRLPDAELQPLPAAREDEPGLPDLDRVMATPAPRVDRIVFVNSNRQVETMDPQGEQRHELTTDAKSYLFPAWSPDGQRIAALGGTIGGTGIYVMADEAENDPPRELYFSGDETPFYLYWSPTGSQIAFLADYRQGGLSLNMIDSAGQEMTRVVALGSPIYWNWTGDGEQMLLHTGIGTENAELVLIDDFGRPRAPEVPAPGPFQAPGISADGRYWAYSQFRSGGTTWLVVSDRLNGEEQSQRHAGSTALSWSPVRSELAFISGDSESGESYWGPLRLLDAATGEMRLLSSDLNLAFFWSPDGEKILTISVPAPDGFDRQFEVREEKDRRLARLSTLPGPILAAQPGQHTFQINVIDVRSGEGLQLVEAVLSPLFLTQFVPFFDQYALSHAIWSPDSNAVVLPLVEERRSEITIIDTRNGRMRPLAEGVIGFWSRQ